MSLRTALLVVAITLGASAPPAEAGTYDVWSCKKPDGTEAPLSGWRYVGVGAPSHICPMYGFSAGLPREGSRASDTAGWWFEAPADTRIAGYELYRTVRVGRGAGSGFWAYLFYHDAPVLDGHHVVEKCLPSGISPLCTDIGIGLPGDLMDPANRMSRAGVAAERLILRIECWAATDPTGLCQASESGGGNLGISRARISLSDAAAPTIVGLKGSLADGRVVIEGSQAVTVTASDLGGGVRDVAVLFDGEAVASTPLSSTTPGCREPYVAVVPCPRMAEVAMLLNTGTVPDGDYQLRFAVTDVAGNRTVTAPRAVRIANGAVPNGSNPSRRAKLTAAFRRNGSGKPTARVRRTVDFRGTSVVTGRLTNGDGQPIAGAVIDVMARARRSGAVRRRIAVVQTRADGWFRYRARGTISRRIRFEYRAFSLDDRVAAAASVVLNARAGVKLRVAPRRTSSRGRIRFAGRLRGRARRGVQVALYAVDRTARRRVPVEVLKTDARGRFRYRYRFMRTFAPFTYRFQARVASQPGYPYAAGRSRIVAVRIVR